MRTLHLMVSAGMLLHLAAQAQGTAAASLAGPKQPTPARLPPALTHETGLPARPPTPPMAPYSEEWYENEKRRLARLKSRQKFLNPKRK